MWGKIKYNIINHVRSNLLLYIIVLFSFLVGIATGAFTVSSLSDLEKEELIGFLDNFFSILGNQDINASMVFKQSLINNIQTLALIWILGITIIGIPIIMFIIGVRGFVIGFTVGFLINEFGIKGLFFVLTGILPQNLIMIPVLMAIGVIGINYSILMVKNRGKAKQPQRRGSPFMLYTANLWLLFIPLLIATFIEAFVTPVFMKILLDIL
ncbi:MAG TPA: stage II sporulation protein M [Clostridiales bacterium]|nr:stage II sporulation protein M [Clostridiales bacterium]